MKHIFKTIYNARSWSFVAVVVAFVIYASPSASFLVSTTSPCTTPKLTNRGDPHLSTGSLSPSIKSSFVLESSNNGGAGDRPLDLGGILGSLASTVVLYSEFVLKTTGCGLPAGPFGLVGAIEGVSYLGVVATCAAAAVDYFSEEGLEGSENPTRRLATALGLSAALIGIAVLAFQVTDYGYIPNAVPMEGGMCK